MVIGIMIILAVIAVGVTMVSQSPGWSEKSFEAIRKRSHSRMDSWCLIIALGFVVYLL